MVSKMNAEIAFMKENDQAIVEPGRNMDISKLLINIYSWLYILLSLYTYVEM